mmetsp:Transcript_8246/g.26577  ORF Transcript_8246/g.26577 Transcript_8246/m.26577 type:complete len:281 (+) Transcript_8246:823-1665(+)
MLRGRRALYLAGPPLHGARARGGGRGGAAPFAPRRVRRRHRRACARGPRRRATEGVRPAPPPHLSGAGRLAAVRATRAHLHGAPAAVPVPARQRRHAARREGGRRDGAAHLLRLPLTHHPGVAPCGPLHRPLRLCGLLCRHQLHLSRNLRPAAAALARRPVRHGGPQRDQPRLALVLLLLLHRRHLLLLPLWQARRRRATACRHRLAAAVSSPRPHTGAVRGRLHLCQRAVRGDVVRTLSRNLLARAHRGEATDGGNRCGGEQTAGPALERGDHLMPLDP